MTPSALATRGRKRANRRLRLLPHVDDRAFLPAALEIIETPASPAAVATVVVIASLVVVALAASWFGRIDVYATARGKVEPAGHAKVVEPLEAGKIASIDVRDGQRVKAGEVVLVLDSSDAGAELDSDLQAAEAARAEALRRAAAVAAARGAPSRNPLAGGRPGDAAPARGRRPRRRSRGARRDARQPRNSQKLEKEAAVAQLETSMTAQKRLIETLEERVSLYQALIDKSVGTRPACSTRCSSCARPRPRSPAIRAGAISPGGRGKSGDRTVAHHRDLPVRQYAQDGGRLSPRRRETGGRGQGPGPHRSRDLACAGRRRRPGGRRDDAGPGGDAGRRAHAHRAGRRAGRNSGLCDQRRYRIRRCGAESRSEDQLVPLLPIWNAGGDGRGRRQRRHSRRRRQPRLVGPGQGRRRRPEPDPDRGADHGSRLRRQNSSPTPMRSTSRAARWRCRPA